ncbi:DUF5007 domain-containing protein [Chitinophaga lutea]
MRKDITIRGITLLAMAAALQACIKVPADVDFLSSQASYTKTVFEPVLGRTTLFPEEPGTVLFNSDNSTLPLTFKLLNFRDSKGDSAEIFYKTFPVSVWRQAYTGDETTREEIEKKRTLEHHRLFELREHSGQFVMWAPENPAYLNSIRQQPDEGYTFDVEVSNSGGKKIIRGMQLKPMRSRPFEPSGIDPVTGNSLGYPSVNSIYGMVDVHSQTSIGSGDVNVVFYKEPESTARRLSIEFRDTAYRPIDPKLFAATKWEELVHHFGTAKFESDKVVYEVAYPIPLTRRVTRYTDAGGSRAALKIGYDRIVGGFLRQQAAMTLNFAIYEPGDWKIVFWFRGANPDFKDN